MKKKEPEKVWKEFLIWINNLSSDYVFRGIGDRTHLLVPWIGRLENYKLRKEIDLFEHFKLRANIFIKANNDFEWLALAQHHGLPTRLLDWTANPLVAAFFTVTKNQESTGRIYCIKPHDFVDPIKDKSPFEINGIQFLFPPVGTRRIELQKGLFSIHPIPQKPAIICDHIFLVEMEYAYKNLYQSESYGFESYNNDPFIYQEDYYVNNVAANYYFDVPLHCKPIFEEKIRKLGVDEMIFGNIDSLSKHLLYQFKKEQIQSFSEPIISYSFTILARKIEEFAVNYFEKNPEKFILRRSYSIVSPIMSFYISEASNESFNYRILKGSVSILLRPNLNQVDDLFEEFPDDSSFSKKMDLIQKEIPSFNLYGSGGCSIKFKANVFFIGDYEWTDIESIDLIIDNRMLDFIKQLEKMFIESINNFKRLTEIISVEEINNVDINSECFKNLIVKLKTHLNNSENDTIT